MPDDADTKGGKLLVEQADVDRQDTAAASLITVQGLVQLVWAGVGRLPRKHDAEGPALHRAQMHHVAVTSDCALSRVVGEDATHSHALRLGATTLARSGAVPWVSPGVSMFYCRSSPAKSHVVPAVHVPTT